MRWLLSLILVFAATQLMADTQDGSASFSSEVPREWALERDAFIEGNPSAEVSKIKAFVEAHLPEPAAASTQQQSTPAAESAR